MRDARATLAGLAGDDVTARYAAVAGAPDTRAAAFALRTVTFTDRDATVRLVAAVRLAQLSHPRVDAWLAMALRDPSPAAREATLRAIARRRSRGAADAVARVLRGDTVWWVRRTAVAALAAVAGDGAVTSLCAALDDPFWRVRDAAVRLLAAMGAREGSARDAVLAWAPSGAEGAAARRYLAALWRGEADARFDARGAARPDDGLWNADPAVVTARLEALTPERVDPMALVEMLPDAHAPLRRRAAWLLRRAASPAALRAACRWLDEPRVPLAVESVAKLFARMGVDARPYARHALATCGAAGLAHAAAWMHALDDDALPDALAARERDADPSVRATATSLRAALEGDDTVTESLDPDDPWRLVEALTPARALEALRAAEDPWLRRAAAGHLDAARRALDDATRDAVGALLADDADPMLRERAARWSRRPDALPRLLALSADEVPSVRAVASGALDACVDLDARLAALRDDATLPVGARLAAWTRSLRHLDAAAFEALCAAWGRDDLGDAVRAHLATLALAFDPGWVARVPSLHAAVPRREVTVRVSPAREASPAPRIEAPRRSLGASGVATPPLCVSGVHGLRHDDYALARDAGVGLFFWEPGYRDLTRWLRRTARGPDAPGVIAGSYEGSPRSIRRDVTRALRALRRPALDVFLLYWVRSPERLSDEVWAALRAMRDEGLVRAVGFSTHHRDLARDAITRRPWDVVMVRHSAAHDGAEREVFPTAASRDVGVLTFSTMSYGRMIRPVAGAPATALPRPIDCYRHAVSRPGVTATVAAPRTRRELLEVLPALDGAPPDDAALAALRVHGAAVHAASRRHNALVRAPRAGALWADDALADAMLEETAADPTAA